MFDRLQSVEDRYEKLNELLSDPANIMTQRNFVNIQKNNLIYKIPFKHIVNIKQ